MHCSPLGSSVHGISQARILEQVAFPSPGDLPNPGIEPVSPALASGFFIIEPPGKPRDNILNIKGPKGKERTLITWRRGWQPTLVFLPD